MERGKDVKNTHHGGNFMNGFLWGAVVGGGLSWVLSHKQGRKILKDLSENGIEALRGILDPENLEEIKENFRERSTPRSDTKREETENYSTPPRPRKRLFKGVKKK